jgi:transcriptional regulator GlxA family with amidase domain
MGGESGRFEQLVAWVKDNLHRPLTIEQMADEAAMSPRNFSRAFLRALGQPPQMLRRATREEPLEERQAG